MQELERFYLNRLQFLKQFSEIDFNKIDSTIVYDRTLEKKRKNPIVIVGEAPGLNEIKNGIPFCGMAGKNLSFLIKLSNLQREKDVLITNAFPFRTFENNGKKNRTPNTKELSIGAKLLEQELSIVKPKLILILGGSAKKAFLKLNDKNLTNTLKSMQNHTFAQVHSSLGFDTMLGLSFHPSPLVFNQKQKREKLKEFFLLLPKIIRLRA